MTITFDCTDFMKKQLRPSTSMGLRVHSWSVRRLIRALCTQSGNIKNLLNYHTLINTSFNVHEEPIVCTNTV